MRLITGVVCVMLALLMAGTAFAGQPMELIAALQQGKIDARFYGNADISVRGQIIPRPFGPDQIYVAPGTQFWAQQPGLQGMTTLGPVAIDLRNRPFVLVEIPVACTNYDRPAPTYQNRMIPYCCPSPRMAALCQTVGEALPPKPVVQLAVWAVANNPEWDKVSTYAETNAQPIGNETKADAAGRLRVQVATLLAQTGIDPSEYRMFAPPAPPAEDQPKAQAQ